MGIFETGCPIYDSVPRSENGPCSVSYLQDSNEVLSGVAEFADLFAGPWESELCSLCMVHGIHTVEGHFCSLCLLGPSVHC